MTDEETKKDAMSEDEMAKKVLDLFNDTKVTAGTKIAIECTSDDGGSKRMSLHQNIYGTPIQLIKMLHAAMKLDNDFKEVIIAAAQLSEFAVSHVEIQKKKSEGEN